MGFYNLEEIITAHKKGQLEAKLVDYDLNDLAFLIHEMIGFAKKQNRQKDLVSLINTLENIMDERQRTQKD